MSELKTLQDLRWMDDWGRWLNREERIREEAKKWKKELNETLERACEKHVDKKGKEYYENAEIEIEGVIYEASAFTDDEVKPIIKFIKHFFNLEEEE